jgi:hypothetical protein
MKEALPHWVSFYKEPSLTSELRSQLLELSPSTIGRMLTLARGEMKAAHGLSGTSPARFMKNVIPLNTFDQKYEKPGHFQADTVAHCGTTLNGAFINSITLTDIVSGWTVNRAMFTKKGIEVRKTFIVLQSIIPFSMLHVNTDSGSEFLNIPVLNFMQNQTNGKPITFTRSRAYKKNDNCYVEQKNFTHVRELFGYERFEDKFLVDIMNEIYEFYWNPLQNFFIPTFKLIEKKRVGAKIVKKFSRPETPYSRLLQSEYLTDLQKEALQTTYKSLDPFELKAGLERKLKFFFEEVRKQQTGKAA